MSSLQFKLDPIGFPMIWVAEIKAHIHWLPVTKIQFEHFLCATSDSRFDANWYERVSNLNKRISPSNVRENNYWQVFITGIRPSEAQRFAEWYGDGYSLPTLKEWHTAYLALKARSAEQDILNVIGAVHSLQERTRALLSKLETAALAAFRYQEIAPTATLADQALLRGGVMEWVEWQGQRTRWGGMGQPNRRFHSILFKPDNGKPDEVINPEGDPLRYYGFRLIERSA
jgi:hypothetical protein